MSNRTDPRTWVEKHSDYLYGYAATRISDEEMAKDLVQDTFLSALQKVSGFEGRSSERTWLTAILKNKIIDVYRKRSSGLKTTIVTESENAPGDFFDPYNGHWIGDHGPKEFGIEDKDRVVSKEFETIIKRCMDKLPPMWHAVFTMRYIDEDPTETVCTELKVSAANFWVIIHRAKLHLRACLQKNWT